MPLHRELLGAERGSAHVEELGRSVENSLDDHPLCLCCRELRRIKLLGLLVATVECSCERDDAGEDCCSRPKAAAKSLPMTCCADGSFRGRSATA
ncbi:hypothetical protein XI03_11470 [Bradyrhizobium sp. CCBAU 65884]|nr:hypothetical protein [Bradyrhizobium sp. CCBAU 65884]